MLLSHTFGVSLELCGHPEVEDMIAWELPWAELGSDLAGDTQDQQPTNPSRTPSGEDVPCPPHLCFWHRIVT